MSKITQENEFAITGARNLLYSRKGLLGLPLLYKRIDDNTHELNFASTGIVVSVKRESSIVPSSDWALVCSDDLSNFLHYTGNPYLSLNLIADRINYFLDETGGSHPSQVVKQENMIVIRGTEDWDSDGICNFLCNVYLDGFGPYAGKLSESTDYYLPPSNTFRTSDYWKVDSNNMVSIQICDLDYYDNNNNHGCDFYILTVWGDLQVNSSVNLSSEYTVQGEDNESVNVMYFDTSSLAEYQYPNILVKMNCIFQQGNMPDFLQNDEWIRSTSGGYGYIFPGNCPYTLSSDVAEPEINASQWAVINNLGNITWIVDQNYESNDDIYNMLAPQNIADTVFDWYKTNHSDLFPSSDSITGNDITFTLELKARTYPSTADYGDSSFSISE